MGFVGWRKAGIVGVDDDLGEERRQPAAREVVAELLLEEVADHPLGLGVEHVEGAGGRFGVRLVLEREQPDLRPLPWVTTTWWSSAISAIAAAATLEVGPLHARCPSARPAGAGRCRRGR